MPYSDFGMHIADSVPARRMIAHLRARNPERPYVHRRNGYDFASVKRLHLPIGCAVLVGHRKMRGVMMLVQEMIYSSAENLLPNLQYC